MAPSSGVKRPAAPALAVGYKRASWLTPEGEIESLSPLEAAQRVRRGPVLLCHGGWLARRLGIDPFPALDLLELYAFVRPARPLVPTARGLAAALSLPRPADLDEEAVTLARAADALLAELAASGDGEAKAVAQQVAASGWLWGGAVLAALAHVQASEAAGLAAWRRLGEWAEHAPEPPPGHQPVEEAEARWRLAALLGADAEARPQQADYAAAASAAFRPREEPDEPMAVLAEAGTGVGKTLGYIAPASLWAEKNAGAVWISTFTRNLQHQIDTELDRLYPEASEKSRRVVIRKGRENYLCLLNFEEAVGNLPTRPATAVGVGLMARWIAASRDGSLVGGDFPGWLPDLIGRGRTLGLADRRGECIHSACPHYHRCFIEKSVRRARRARLVVANHALVMVQAAWGGIDDSNVPTRYVFDEGHHVFEAADNAFSLALTGREAVELRRWLLGVEGGRGRARGLRRRLEDLVAGDEVAEKALLDAQAAARVLPGEGWLGRLNQNAPYGAMEAFLAHARRQVLARAEASESAYSLETEARPPVEGLLAAAAALGVALRSLITPLETLAKQLVKRLDDEAADLDPGTRLRIDAAARSLKRRTEGELMGWSAMLADLPNPGAAALVDWFAIDRYDGHEIDVGMHRHWIDPTRPFVETVAKPAQGLLITSATLTDGTGDPVADWAAAEMLTGARHLSRPALRARVPSPFDYRAQTRIFVVTDVKRDSMEQVAAAYRTLFLAAGGGALGLFTAIQRLRAVHGRIAAPLEEAGLPLLAQHVDAMDTATLVDIFRAEEDACLLGTDAVRDGVDVPGRSLRLIVFDRVPWPRPDILHKARRAEFGGSGYDDRITRLRLRQAFGRLVRRAGDTGVFVLLDSRLPSRLLGAFPEGVSVERIGLAEATEKTRAFLLSRTEAGSAAAGS
ncbi:MAG TPA: ATP-dependent DNA helicase [Stellaceae bacterium]|nr:ATP-dependent DNA helicase [Stellaceae bacterium]